MWLLFVKSQQWRQKKVKQDLKDTQNMEEEVNLFYFGFVFIKIHAKAALVTSRDVLGLDDTVIIEGN